MPGPGTGIGRLAAEGSALLAQLHGCQRQCQATGNRWPALLWNHSGRNSSPIWHCHLGAAASSKCRRLLHPGRSAAPRASAEASSLGSELMAMKHGTEHARGLRHKLRVAGAPAGLPAFARAGSKPAAASSSAPEPALGKWSSSAACSFAREGCAAGEWRATCASANGSLSGLVAKRVAPGEKRG